MTPSDTITLLGLASLHHNISDTNLEILSPFEVLGLPIGVRGPWHRPTLDVLSTGNDEELFAGRRAVRSQLCDPAGQPSRVGELIGNTDAIDLMIALSSGSAPSFRYVKRHSAALSDRQMGLESSSCRYIRFFQSLLWGRGDRRHVRGGAQLEISS